MNLGTEIFFGKKFTFTAVTGTVHNIVKQNRMEISGGGSSGAFVNGYGGVVTNNISTKNHTDMEFWVHTNDGCKLPFNIPRSNVLLAENQHVSLIFAERESNPKKELWVGLINHDAKIYWTHNLIGLRRMAGKKYAELYQFLCFVGFFGVIAIAMFSLLIPHVGWILSILLIVTYVYKIFFNVVNANNVINKNMDEILRKAMDQIEF
jgi:hypothetical protein